MHGANHSELPSDARQSVGGGSYQLHHQPVGDRGVNLSCPADPIDGDVDAEARAQLAHIARVTTLGELTASIAHEVNQPLAAVITSGNACLRWLDGQTPNLAKAKQSVERIVNDANRASEVVGRVRNLAKRAVPKRAG